MLQRVFNHLIAPKLALASAKSAARKRGLDAFQVLGVNMAPTIEAQDIAWFEALPASELVSRGQVVVFTSEAYGSAVVPSRVVGLPDEDIEIRDGSLLVNGALIDEPYLQFGRAEQSYSRSCQRTSVPKGHLWLLGDFRDMSKDSRNIGAVPVAAVLGRITHVHPPGRHNHPREV